MRVKSLNSWFGLYRSLWLCVTLLLPMMSHSSQGSDSFIIAPFKGAEQLEHIESLVDRYPIILSELKRSNATSYAEKSISYSGQLQRSLWSLPRRSSLNDVIAYYQQQLKPYQMLYQCSGLDCGSSHFWANQVFENALLVTREKAKHYMAVQRKTATGFEVITLYIAQRGSRQILVNIDRLSSNDRITINQTNINNIQQLLRDQSGWLPGLVVKQGLIDELASQDLLASLKSVAGPDRENLHLITHCYQFTEMSDNLACSIKLADQLRVLSFDNISEIAIYGQGALVTEPESSLEPALRFIYWPPRR